MIKTILVLIAKVLESRLNKSGVEEKLLKYKSYTTFGKALWNKIDEEWRISKTVEEKVQSKAEAFDKALLAKFPELTQDDVTELRQSIAGEVNAGKEAVISNSDLLKQLQATNITLTAENTELKNTLAQIQSTAAKTNVQA
ncbi:MULTISPECIES: hypothetical protein [unclassified Clostridium]|uniref:hypothetical protein n=1 Tax=unclassified Clostridium TaxID=2614128 RepID=UPI0002978FBE|nr:MULTISPECIES: hypothetical protein [unclassified Clostridium]EKQ51381.1 MAG: hypothetical protein A370_04908 [Clostridium sp. Maddingley MBC34-26]